MIKITKRLRQEYNAGFDSGQHHNTGLLTSKWAPLYKENERKMLAGIKDFNFPMIKVYWQGYYDAMNGYGRNNNNILYPLFPKALTIEHGSNKVAKGAIVVYLYDRWFANIWQDHDTGKWALNRVNFNMDFPSSTWFDSADAAFDYLEKWFLNSCPVIKY